MQILLGMRYKLVKLTKLSGYKASIYLKDEQRTLFDRFLEENKYSFKSELNDIVLRLHTIGHHTGAWEDFFRLKEGKGRFSLCIV